MPSFRVRSEEKELLDGEGLSFEEIRTNMLELDRINQLLGGHAVTLKGLSSLLKDQPVHLLHIVEIGCGGGDNLRVVKNWCARRGRPVQLTGIDINPECIAYARSRPENSAIHFVCSDYEAATFERTPTIIFSSLFCHHFSDRQIVSMLQWMDSNTTGGFFINDLHRHPVAYYAIKVLTALFSKSRLVRNDAPLSVQRGFSRDEWKQLSTQAGIGTIHCEWKWAFRWLLLLSKW